RTHPRTRRPLHRQIRHQSRRGLRPRRPPHHTQRPTHARRHRTRRPHRPHHLATRRTPPIPRTAPLDPHARLPRPLRLQIPTLLHHHGRPTRRTPRTPATPGGRRRPLAGMRTRGNH